MLSVSALFLCFCPAAAPQAPAGGLEQLVSTLEQQTLERRSAAETAWKTQGKIYLTQPSRGTMSTLLDFAPYIQEPVLDSLESNLRTTGSNPAQIGDLLQLLGRCMNRGGAARLLPLLPELPKEHRATALRYAIEQGGVRTRRSAHTYLSSQQADVRQSALETLLLHQDERLVPGLLANVDPGHVDLESFGAILELVAQRELPEGVLLPKSFYEQKGLDFINGLVSFMGRYPQPDTEDYLVERALLPRNEGLSIEARKSALGAYESGSAAFRWRAGTRQMTRFLKDENPGEATYAVAWTLHRLGEKSGRKHLLAGPEERAKANPDDWRTQMVLGRMQVDVGEFNSAYKTIKNTFEEIDGTPAGRRLSPDDYLYAARAAAGARRPKESGRWLTATRYSPIELAPYRDLPEFQQYLKKAPFNHLFPVAD
ncbi:MAG: hypothetical protein GY747_11540 [Planctomycetes bacterium]|nr:hypothetical protein [Planctomycetota bacterium]MCP4772264.1 hypothetical protein [Planctomycetota bacterium]MCP4861320.1 hypothetical protein [Planctomycetota bacterium]